MKNNVKKIIYVISFSLLICLFIALIYLTIDSKRITDIRQFIAKDIKVLYVTNNDNIDYPTTILDRYSIDYLKVNINKLTVFERKKIENIVENKNLNNILCIYQNGEIEDVLVEYKSKKSVNKFLQKNNIIPDELVENVEEIMNESQELLDSLYTMVYIPYKNLDDIEKQDKIFKNIAEAYSIDYKKIDAYLLSKFQQEKINNLLGLSLVEDQILVLIKDKKMIANIRGVHSKNTYIEKLYSVNFINEIADKINKIDYNTYKEILNANEKSIILIGTEQLKDSNEVIDLLNEMSYNYDIEVNYIEVDEEGSYIYKKVKEKLENIGYDGAFSLPLVVIVESNKVLDYAIGNSKEEYFLDIFIENGVIKGDVINE